MKVLLASHSAQGGGAFKASLRLHQALRSIDVEASLAVGDLEDHDNFIRKVGSTRKEFRYARSEVQYFKAYVEALIVKFQRTSNPLLRSPALLPGSGFRDLISSDADVLNLHWVCGGFLSVSQIGSLLERFPTVWTLHDQWAFLGTEHYGFNGSDLRWNRPLEGRSRLRFREGIDIDSWTWQRKQKKWRSPAYVITPSNWLASQVSQSELMGDWPVKAIPNPVNLETFRPLDQSVCREILGLPADVPLVLFAAMGGSSSPAKGWDLLAESISYLRRQIPEVQVVAIGRSASFPAKIGNVTVNRLGFLGDEFSMSLAYNAASLVAVPSRVDNLPQTATEAQSCGRPVVAFRVGGLPDTLVDGETGLLAEAFDVEELASKAASILTSEVMEQRMGSAARERARKCWSPKVIAEQYLGVFSEASRTRVRH